VQGEGKVVQVRDEIIPYVEPADFMNGVSAPQSINDRTILVLVRSHSGQFAVRVDELLSHEQVVIKSLEGYSLENNELISGGAILGDGSVGLILDVPGMVRAYRQGTHRGGSTVPEQ
ncbi:MAG: chemotaxis protein CheW, partial [bacterium]